MSREDAWEGRSAESGLSIDSLRMLEEEHKVMIRKLQGLVVIIDGTWDSKRVEELDIL